MKKSIKTSIPSPKYLGTDGQLNINGNDCKILFGSVSKLECLKRDLSTVMHNLVQWLS